MSMYEEYILSFPWRRFTRAAITSNTLGLICKTHYSDHGMLQLDQDPISISKYVDASDVYFKFFYGATGLIEPMPGKKEKVYSDLKSNVEPCLDSISSLEGLAFVFPTPG